MQTRCKTANEDGKTQILAVSRMRPAYIYVSHVRNDPVLRNYNFGAYRYWGDRITFKDAIEFRPSAPLSSETR